MKAFRSAVSWMRNTFSQDELLAISHVSAFALLAWVLGFSVQFL
jgi:hypothetical protein